MTDYFAGHRVGFMNADDVDRAPSVSRGMLTDEDERARLVRRNARLLLDRGTDPAEVLYLLRPTDGVLCPVCAVPVPTARRVCSPRCRAIVAGRGNRGSPASGKPKSPEHRAAISAAIREWYARRREGAVA